MSAPDWAPALEQVASYITSRTIRAMPGADAPSGTFDTDTWPTRTQVELLIDDACQWVVASAGAIASSVEDMAKPVAAIRTAAMVELTYPRTTEDVNTASVLLAQAAAALAVLASTNRGATGVDPSNPGSTLLPIFSFPCPSPYGDWNL